MDMLNISSINLAIVEKILLPVFNILNDVTMSYLWGEMGSVLSSAPCNASATEPSVKNRLIFSYPSVMLIIGKFKLICKQTKYISASCGIYFWPPVG